MKVLNEESKDRKSLYDIEMKEKLPDVLPNIPKESKKFVKTFVPLVSNTIIEEGAYVLGEMGMGMKFSKNEIVTEYLEKHPIKFSTVINTSTNKKIRKVLNEGIEKGEDIHALSKRVKVVYNKAKGNRSKTIARTETARATGFATEEAYKQSGVVEGKQWLTAVDERTCEFCRPMDNKTMSLGKSYFDKGSSFKGDGGGTIQFDYDKVNYPPLHVNCRCSLTPVVYDMPPVDDKFKKPLSDYDLCIKK